MSRRRVREDRSRFARQPIPAPALADTVPSDLLVYGLVYPMAPVSYVVKAADQSITNNTEEAVTFTTAALDNLNIWSNSADAFYPTVPGMYRIMFHARWEIVANGERRIRIIKNASTTVAQARLAATVGEDTYDMYCETLVEVGTDASPYYWFAAFQDSGGGVKVVGDGTVAQTWASIQYLGRAR